LLARTKRADIEDAFLALIEDSKVPA
ncbi:MAG: hypothetical protein QOH80_1213, partial [Actinomycetota bacterium]|nr:hypothetical protein [Actinomycetota bacterium]